MYKIGVLGDRSSIYGFAAAGIDLLPAEDASSGARLLREAAEDYAVIFITEKLAAEIPAELDRYRDRPLPAIIPIPGVTGNTGIGLADISRAVEKAVGADILK